MKTRIAASSGLALMLVVGIFAALLALGQFEAKPVLAAATTGGYSLNSGTLTISPDDAGALADYRITVTVTGTDATDGALLANKAQFRITFDKDTQIPASISRDNVLISASDVSSPSAGVTPKTAGGQVRPLSVDPVIEFDVTDSRRKVLVITVPDMTPGDTAASGGLGAQGIASGGTQIANDNTTLVTVSTVDIIFTSGALIKNANKAETSSIDVQVCEAAGNCTAVGDQKVTDKVKAKLTLSGVDGGRGTNVTVSGKGFKSKTSATLWIESAASTHADYGTRDSADTDLTTVLVGSNGTFAASVSVGNPPFSPGPNVIFAQDGEETSTSRKLDKDGGVTWTLRGAIVVSPKSFAIGEVVTFQLQDYDASGQFITSGSPATDPDVTMLVGGVELLPTTTGNVSTDSSGSATFSARIPNGVALGTQQVRIGGGNLGSKIRNTTVVVLGADLEVTPQTVLPNQTLSLSGNNFTSSDATSDVRRLNTISEADAGSCLDASDKFLLEGEVIAEANINGGAKIDIASGGNWSSSLVLPVTSKTTTPGTFSLKAIDCHKREGVASIVIPLRELSVTPADSRVGSTIVISGTNFPVTNTKSEAASITVEITYKGTSNVTTTATPDAGGNFSVTMQVPTNTNIPSTNTIEAKIKAGGTEVGTVTTTTHTVPRAFLTLDPTSGPAGTRVTATAQGFKNYFSVDKLTFGGSDITPSPKPTTGDTGAFELSFTAPAQDTGTQTVEVTVDTVTASASFIVLAVAPTPVPPPVAATEAPANALKPLIDNNDNLQRVWHFDPSKQSVAPDFGWFLYDPRPVFAAANSVEEIAGGKFYWINVREAQTAVLGGISRGLFAGWNPVTW